MILHLVPMRREDRLTVSRNGDVLTLNGEAFDFAALPDGATLPREAIASAWFAGDGVRKNGVLTVPLILPHGATAPADTLFRERIALTGNGPVSLPPHQTSEERV